MPELPQALHHRLITDYKLSEYDTAILTENKQTALYFSQLCQATTHYKAAANWMNGPVKSWLNENGFEMHDFPVAVEKLAEIIELVESGEVSFSTAGQKIFPILVQNPDKNARNIAQENNWIQERNEDEIKQWIAAAIERFPEKVKEYQAGKTGLIGLFMGEVMKLSKGKADPKTANQLVKEALDNYPS